MEQSVYISRPVLNSDEIILWASKNGAKSHVDLHTSIVFFKKPFDWNKIQLEENEITVDLIESRITKLGKMGRAKVIIFKNYNLYKRRNYFLNLFGLSSKKMRKKFGQNFHVTMTYFDFNFDYALRYSGKIVFGPEQIKVAELKCIPPEYAINK